MRGRLVLALAAAASEVGVPAELLISRIGLSAAALADDEVFVDLEAYLGLWEHVMRTLRDPGFPVAYARGIKLESFGLPGFAALTSPDGLTAAQRMARYQRLTSDSGRLTIDVRDEVVRLRWERPGPLTLGMRVANEAVLAEAMAMVRQVGGEQVIAAAVRFRHPAPADTSAHRRFFGVSPRFGEPEDALDVPRTLLARRMPLANPDLATHFVTQAEARMRSAGEGIAARVERAALAELPSGAPSMRRIARSLELSERQLRRELASAGLGFRSLVEDLRRDRAAALLGQEHATVVDTAFVLGFSEVSAFSRAFKRWFGLPPAEYRQRGAL
jgi:AraC-like DNA-binding protein